MSASLIHLAVVLGAFFAGLGAGWDVTRVHYAAEIADTQRARAQEEASAATAATARLQAAQRRGDALETRLAGLEADRQTQTRKHANEIERLTTGRPCLNGGTVRLLNQPGPGIRLGLVPAPAGEPPAADAAAASDTDVAGWIDGTRQQYDTCRGRLQALIDWHAPEAP